MSLIAFHGKQETKYFYLDRVRKHQQLDEIIKGKYWENGKGCAVGCTIHSSEHNAYETELGIPEWLARLEDTIFEGLPSERAKLWPEQFLFNMNIGSDLDKIKTPFIIFVLESSLESMERCKYDEDKFPDVKSAIENSKNAVIEMIRCHTKGIDLSAKAAWSAAESAKAAWSAAESAKAAWSAAESAKAAWSAAESAKAAAWSAAWSARSARSAVSAAVSAAVSEYEKFADKLLELIRECK